MKKFTLLTFSLLSSICFSQEKFTYNIEGLSPKYTVLGFPEKPKVSYINQL